MVTNITAGIIGCNMTEDFFRASAHNKVEKFHWKKILADKAITNIEQLYPEAEMVDSIQAIINDNDISLVFVSNNHLNIVPNVLESGKAVRIV